MDAATSPHRPRVRVPKPELDEFCRRNPVRRLALFGSVLRDDFGPESDIDVVVEFEPEHVPGFHGLAGMDEELAVLFGRRVDLNALDALRPKLRQRRVPVPSAMRRPAPPMRRATGTRRSRG